MKGKARTILVLLAVLLMAAGGFAAETGKIVGRVQSADTGDPLIGANVTIQGTHLGASTDLEGFYYILNVPPGTYVVKISILGYKEAVFKNVKVSSDRTTTLDARMQEAVMEAAEEVVLVVRRPMIRRDATDSRTTRTADEMDMMPVENIQDVVRLTAGTVGGNFRGGRATEVNYLIDGASFVDPMNGTYEGFIPQIAVEEVNVITGGQSAEYGNMLSGVVSQVTKEGGDHYRGSILFRTNDMASTPIGERDQLKDMQASVSGPLPFISGLGDLRLFLAGQYFSTRGRFVHDDSTLTSGFGKLTYSITPRHKLTVSGTLSNSYFTMYSHLWSRTTVEDRLDQYSPYLPDGTLDPANVFVDANGNPWFGNGQVDTEDLNHNGVIDPGEDLDGDGTVDTEDLNHNFKLDEYSLLDHLPYYFQHTDQFAVKWNHTISSKTFYEISLSRYNTKMTYNTRERYNEDANGNGMLDLEPRYGTLEEIPDEILEQYRDYLKADNPDDPSYYWFDFNGNGAQEWEDLNGNEIWDWQVYGSGHDLFIDENDNGIVDASENAPGSQWASWGDGPWNSQIRWEDLVFNSNTRDNDDFYLYGDGKTYNRARWNKDYKIIWTGRASITSQVHQYHQINSGIELKFMEIFDHDVDMASGGNVYGQNFKAFPRLYGVWAEDKMEFEGMVLNAGLRLDVFDINWDDYPADITDPVVDPSIGGQVKNPVSIKPKTYWGPRLGVAFPITERDLLSFSYSRNFQVPILRYAYTNVNWDFSGAFPIVGNPNLEPERTTAYEMTLRHQFTTDMAVVGTGFYKDISGLTDTRQVFYDARNWYGLYINLDYGNVRGFEVSLEKRFSHFYSGTVSYTYSVAKGKASNARQNYINAWANNVIKTTENYLDWDQRHTVYANLQFMIPRGTNLFGTKSLDGVMLSLIGRYGSGLPFSSPSRDKDPPINDQRLPYTMSFDGRLQKRTWFSDNMALVAYLQVYNIFNQVNIDQRFFQANADTDWYMNQDSDGDGVPDKDVDGKHNDPRYWQRERVFQVGLKLEF